DCIPERDIIDYHISPYCDAFLDFLLSANLCILNGRNCIKNDYTSISTKGCAVVDYCLVPYEQLNRYEHFNLLQKSTGINTLDRITIPDHSVLQWTLSMTNFKNVDSINTSVVNGKLNKSKIIHDRQNIPEVFMNNHDMYELLKEKINLLEADRDRQEHIDNSYTEFLDILNSQMKTHLNPREINLNVNNTKNKRVNKPWWNEDLSVEWKGVCVSEKLWLNCKIRSQKNLLKAIFMNKRKLFDKNVKRRKRAHWHDEQSKLLKACENTNKSDFWKDIGKIGIGCERNKSIPIEVLLADGSVSTLPQDVLNKWKNSFEKLYNVPNINNEPGCAVVDYCLVPYEQLNRYEHFNLLQKSTGINTLDRITIPDHSVLQWTLSMTNFKNVDSINTSVVNGKLNKSKIIHDRQNIPEVFMNNHDMYELLKEKINLLEADRDRQEHIDNSYTEFLDILNSQMKTHLNPREINLNVNNTKNKRVNKPWWNEDLSVEWKGVCVSEKLWLNCKIRSQKNLLKAIFMNKRKLFDKNVKRRKRAHWHDEQSKLLKACENTNKSDFWKDIGKIGIGCERNKSIPIEVLLADGSVSTLPQDVLNKWKNSFEKLYNVPNINNE
ncbi:hypothetical protein MAR_037928, partial [Mya arenaria]